MRYFIALEIPEKSKSQIEAIQKKLGDIVSDLRMTNPQKLHLTIAFIGEQSDSIKEELIKVMQEAVQGIEPFTVTPAYIDGFPELHDANIFWVGVKGDIDKLMVLRERIKDMLVNLRLDVDVRRYVPHIAIAKASKVTISENQEKQLQQMMMSEFAPIYIDSIKLFESVPEQGLHYHNTLAEVTLH